MVGIKENFITIAGCGPGSPDYLTPAVCRAVERADSLVGARRLLDLFPDSRAEKIAAGANIGKILNEIEARRLNRNIVVLVTGDPGLCSLAQPVIRRFGRENCRIIPGVSSLQIAFARLGVDWRDVKIIDAHGEDPPYEPEFVAGEGKIAVFAGRKDSVRWIGRLAAVLGKGYRIHLCEDLGLPRETVKQVEEKELTERELSPLSVVVFIREELMP